MRAGYMNLSLQQHKRANLTIRTSFSSRNEPPTNEELSYNLAIIEMKKSNAKKLDDKFGTNKEEKIVTGMAYPTYDEYERVPGKKPGEQWMFFFLGSSHEIRLF